VAIELAPQDLDLRNTHVMVLFANGLYVEALVESAKALEVAPEDEQED
jgi:hypothetical protein